MFSKNPFTVIGEDQSRTVFHVGLYQDTTDQTVYPRRSGHYQSLEIIPGKSVPCCRIESELVSMSVPITSEVEIDILQNDSIKY